MLGLIMVGHLHVQFKNFLKCFGEVLFHFVLFCSLGDGSSSMVLTGWDKHQATVSRLTWPCLFFICGFVLGFCFRFGFVVVVGFVCSFSKYNKLLPKSQLKCA